MNQELGAGGAPTGIGGTRFTGSGLVGGPWGCTGAKACAWRAPSPATPTQHTSARVMLVGKGRPRRLPASPSVLARWRGSWKPGMWTSNARAAPDTPVHGQPAASIMSAIPPKGRRRALPWERPLSNPSSWLGHRAAVLLHDLQKHVRCSCVGELRRDVERGWLTLRQVRARQEELRPIQEGRHISRLCAQPLHPIKRGWAGALV